MTWPLVTHVSTAVAYPGDPYINTWILDWDWYATLHQPLHLFDANAFHPAKDSLAFSENLYGIAMAVFPLRLLGVDALTAHNIALLLGFAFSGFGMFVLGRLVSGSTAAGVAAGVFYAFVPFRFTQLPHVQHVFAGWVPMLLAALLHYARRPAWDRAALFGMALLFNGLSNIHWLLFGTIAVALTVPIALPRRRHWAAIITAAVIAFILLVPFLAPYATVSKLYGMRRAAEIAEFSARPRDWLNPGVSNRLYRHFADTRVDPERWLFPGVLAIAFAAAGLIAQRERRPIAVAALWIALGVVGSFGLHPLFAGFGAVRVFPAQWDPKLGIHVT